MNMPRIRISAGPVVADATLADTATAKAIQAALPLTGRASTWGDEIYFDCGLSLSEEDAQTVVEVGDLAYWPPGSALCIFFGPTPASRGDEIRAASPVDVFGRVEGDPTVFRQVDSGTPVTVEAADTRSDRP
jgi:hypothetical protein